MFNILFFISQLKNNFEIDPEAAEKIIVKREDFHHALEHDIKPVSKTSLLSILHYKITEILRALLGVFR